MNDEERKACALQAAAAMSAAEFMKKHGATVQISSRNDQLNSAELERVETKFGSSIPPAGVESCTLCEKAAEPSP